MTSAYRLLCALSIVVINFSSVAHATQDVPDAILTGFESWHAEQRDVMNPHNPGIGLRMMDGYTLGAYYNSYKRYSVYAGREWQWRVLGNDTFALHLGGVAGLVTGYKGGVSLLLVPEIVAVAGPLELGVIFVPKTTKYPATIGGQLRLRF